MKTYIIALLLILIDSTIVLANPGMGRRMMKELHERQGTETVAFTNAPKYASNYTNTPVKSIENDIRLLIAKDLKDTKYIDKLTTVDFARTNYSGNALNCGQYAFRVNDVAKKNGYKTEIWHAGGSHLIIIVINGNKRYCYSNGLQVKEYQYEKITKIKD